jgi:geranylgeranyl reductase family protein
MNRYDVAVIGGGPSGLQAARGLAHNGLSVLVLEKKKEIGANVICTGIISQDVFQEFGIPKDSVIRDIGTMKIVSPSGQSITYQHPRPFASVVDRTKFDHSLALEAGRAGADFKLGECVTEIEMNDHGVELTARREDLEEKKYRAAMVILATGIDYHLNRRLGLGCPKNSLTGVQAEIEASNGTSPTIFFGQNIAPGAFAWAVPTAPGKLKIGLLTEHEPRKYFSNFLKIISQEWGDAATPASLDIKAIAQGLVVKSYGERVLVLGEAAGQVKTTTGGGIYYGLLCSRIAADVVFKACRDGSFKARQLAEYEHRWKAAIKNEIIIGYYARRLFARLNNDQIESLFEIAKSDGIIPLVQKKGHFDWQSDLILDLVKKAPVFSLLRNIPKKPVFFERYLS